MKKKWYLQTWFIALLFFIAFFFIVMVPIAGLIILVIGIALIIIQQILRCFQAECTNLLLNLSVKNIDSVRSKIAKSFESLNKIFEIDGVVLNSKLH